LDAGSIFPKETVTYAGRYATLIPRVPNFHQKKLFLTIKSFFGCHDAKWALVLLRKLFFLTKKIDFSKIRLRYVQFFNLAHMHKPKFGLFFF